MVPLTSKVGNPDRRSNPTQYVALFTCVVSRSLSHINSQPFPSPASRCYHVLLYVYCFGPGFPRVIFGCEFAVPELDKYLTKNNLIFSVNQVMAIVQELDNDGDNKLDFLEYALRHRNE